MNNKKLSKKEAKLRKENEQKMRETGIRMAKASFIRYGTAFLAVVSLYWAATAYLVKNIYAIIPILYLLAYLFSSADQHLTIFKHKEGEFNWTYYVMIIFIVINLILLISIMINPKLVFPYFVDDLKIPLIGLIVGIFIKLLIIIKIKKYKKTVGEKNV
ncbi:hypothetical protein [Helcococcus massiliensis]|uniref:hypothetical protein n=1 Tax=Helcococcus massiliensis TaxID=2040290 RepID=UPI000CDEFE69|nr:hypothetical protein [Helcococcus massiliensis]